MKLVLVSGLDDDEAASCCIIGGCSQIVKVWTTAWSMKPQRKAPGNSVLVQLDFAKATDLLRGNRPRRESMNAHGLSQPCNFFLPESIS